MPTIIVWLFLRVVPFARKGAMMVRVGQIAVIVFAVFLIVVGYCALGDKTGECPARHRSGRK